MDAGKAFARKGTCDGVNECLIVTVPFFIRSDFGHGCFAKSGQVISSLRFRTSDAQFTLFTAEPSAES